MFKTTLKKKKKKLQRVSLKTKEEISKHKKSHQPFRLYDEIRIFEVRQIFPGSDLTDFLISSFIICFTNFEKFVATICASKYVK